jgi:hypothetical protein
MRATTYGTSRHDNTSTITIQGSEAEIDALKKMVAGLGYVACGREGMPLFAEKFAAVVPIPDPQLMQHFTPWGGENVAKYSAEKPEVKLELSDWDNLSCSIYVEHLCGYSYTPESYASEANKFTAMGFVCMRSPRDSAGRYYEAWFLPGLFAGKGLLEGMKTVEQAINVIIRHTRPGSISAVRQRMALTVD